MTQKKSLNVCALVPQEGGTVISSLQDLWGIIPGITGAPEGPVAAEI